MNGDAEQNHGGPFQSANKNVIRPNEETSRLNAFELVQTAASKCI